MISWGSSGGNSSSVASAIDGVPDAQDVVDIVATNDAFAALRVDGSVVTWGNPSRGGDSSAVDFEGTSDDLHVSRLFSNFYAFSALRSDGSIVAWGDPDHGGSGVPSFDASNPSITIASTLTDEWYRIESPDSC